MEKLEFGVDIWVIQTSNKRFVGVDYAAGGKPYETNFFLSAKWPTKQAAEVYKTANKESEWKIQKIKTIELE